MAQPASARPPLPLRLAYFSPWPPARSGIVDYSLELLPHLAQLAELTLFAEAPELAASLLPADLKIRTISEFPAARWRYNLAIYQMGNSAHHEAMYPTALRYPGLVVLHDTNLHHFIADRTVGRGNYPAYVREMGYAQGAKGTALAWNIWSGRAEHPLGKLPLNDRLIDRSLGLIVHSRKAAEMIRGRRPERPVEAIPALIGRRPGQSRRARLNLPPETVIFASTGQVTAAKRLDLALGAFAQLRQEMPACHYLIVGEAHPEVDVPGLITRLELGEAVTWTGYVEGLDEFVDWTATADVVVNLRYPTAGETSATALRALAAGRPVIVFDIGWYGELPDDVAFKIDPLDEGALLRAMRILAQEPERRQEMGRQGVAYIQDRHDPARVAEAYAAFIRRLQASWQARLSNRNADA